MEAKDKLILESILNYIVSCAIYVFATYYILPGIFTFINSIAIWIFILLGGLILISGIIWIRFYLKYREIKKNEKQ